GVASELEASATATASFRILFPFRWLSLRTAQTPYRKLGFHARRQNSGTVARTSQFHRPCQTARFTNRDSVLRRPDANLPEPWTCGCCSAGTRLWFLASSHAGTVSSPYAP